MTFMMLNADVVACSQTRVYRVLEKTGLPTIGFSPFEQFTGKLLVIR